MMKATSSDYSLGVLSQVYVSTKTEKDSVCTKMPIAKIPKEFF